MPSTAEIVARLTLNGEKFSAETSRLFGSLETAAKEAGQKVEGQLAGRLEKIKEIAARGVSIDFQGLKEGAAGAAATAASLKTVADAADRVAARAGGLDNALNAQAKAARNAASASEMRAAKLVEEARAMDLLQAELGQTVAAQGRMQASAKNTGGSLAMAGQQVQDFMIQVQNGQNPVAAFSQQMSQMGFALQGTGGWLGKVGNILQGPWGLAIVGAGLVAASFSDQIFGTTDKIKEQVKALEDQARKTRDSERAQEMFGKTAEGAAASIDQLTKSLDSQNRSLSDNIALSKQKLQGDLAIVRAAIAADRREIGRLSDGLGAGAAAGGGVAGAASTAQSISDQRSRSRIAELEERVKRFEGSIASGERALRQVDLPLINRDVEESMTAEGRAARALRIELERLTRARSDGAITAGQYRQQSQAARAANAAELERLRKERPSRSTRVDNDRSSFINPVGGGRVTGQWNEQRTGRRHAGVDLAVPVGTAVKAAAGGVIIETGNDPGGYGNFVIIDHGRGTTTRYAHLLSIGKGKGAAVDQGDVIGASGGARGAAGSGNSRGPHLHYEVRQGGRPVDPRGGSFATDVANVQDAASDRLEATLKRQEEIRDRLLAQAERGIGLAVEEARIFGLNVAGLDKQAESEKAIAAVRRESAEWLKQSTEGMDPKQAEAFLAAEAKVGDAFKQKLDAVEKQGTAYASLLAQSGDLSALTDAQKAAILQQNDALATQLEGAKALARTAEERKLLEEAIVRLQGKGKAGADAGRDAVDFQKKIVESNQKAADSFREEELRRQEDAISNLANFYEDAFNSGGKSIWKQFKDEGKRALAMIAAQYTLALLSGQKVSLGSMLGQMGAVSGVGGGGSLGGGMASGILGLFGGSRAGPVGGGVANSVSSVIPMPNADFGSILRGGMGEGGALGSGAGGGIASGANIGTGLTIGLVGSALLGGKGGAAGQLGGSLGGIAGQLGGVALGKMLGMAGSAAGPIGAIVGTLAGTLLGGLIGKPKAQYGTSSISAVGGAGTVMSRGDGFGSAATGAGKSVQDALGQILEQLGGTAGGFNVSIGQYKDSWRVNTNGYNGGGLNFKGTSANGLHDFGQDQEAAIRFAIQDALNDGAVKGISDASLRILKAGGDLDASLKKALAIESIPKRLKQMTDPLGYAIDELNKKWAETVAALKEGGASAEQMADAQKLYKLELAETKSSARDATEGLKNFLKSIDFGSASPFSIRDQRAKAEAELAPYLASIAKGEAVDTGKFTDAAQALLELERQLFGSTGQYFESVEKIRSATNAAISTIDPATPGRSAIPDPFAEATATNTATTNDLLDQHSQQLAAILAQLRINGGGGGASDGGFVGGSANRQFANVQLV